MKKVKYNVFTNLYKIFEIIFLVSIFFQKYQVGPLVFYIFLSQFSSDFWKHDAIFSFSLNFLNQIFH